MKIEQGKKYLWGDGEVYSIVSVVNIGSMEIYKAYPAGKRPVQVLYFSDLGLDSDPVREVEEVEIEVNMNLKYQTADGLRVTLVSNKGSQPHCILGIIHRDTWDDPWRWDKYGKCSVPEYNLEEIPEKEEKVDFGSY